MDYYLQRIRRNSVFQRLSWRRLLRAGAALLLLVAVFRLGIAVGDGQLYRLLSTTKSKNASLPAKLDYTSVDSVYDALKQNYDGKLTAAQLLDGLKSGLAKATGDPYTEYYTAEQAKAFSDSLNSTFSGVGAELGKDDQGNIIIVSPIKGFPAHKAGLKPQDVIAEINGQSTSGMAPDMAVSKIRGPKGTRVTLKIVRSKSQALTLTITRDTIQLPSVTSKVLPGNIGYMQISSFADDTAGLARQVAQSFKDAKVRGVILDLRGNPGGYLNAAINVSSLWLPAGKTIVTEKGTIPTEVSTATGDDILAGVSTVVLIDGGSASASEITAGALRDNGAARLVGTKSYGKGVVQQLDDDLPDGGVLKVTVARWYRPNGQNIQKQGITPDQVVDLSEADAKAGNDTQLKAAEAYLRQPQ